ncbi:MAG: CARDB domain-containing protein [Parvularculaceae bacterium]
MRKIIGILCAFGALLAAGEAAAYGYSTCLGEKLKWDSNSKQLRANNVSFPAGTWFNGISDAINKFNLNPSNFRYTLVSEGGGVGRNNGQSEAWGDTGSILDGAPAIAYSYWTCYWLFGDHVHMNEVDVIFDYGSPWQWTASSNRANLIRYGGSLRPLQTTGGHEFGHGLKLNHVNYEYNIMGTDFEHIHVNGTTARAYMGEDAADGAVFLYGARSGAWEDVGVVHWKYSGASGEYSDHTKTRVLTSAGGALPTLTINGETGYRVSRGQSVRLELTYENMGKSLQGNVQTGYFISTNDFISTSDRRIGGASWSLGRGDVFTTTVTLTIPNDLALNTNYWIGAVVDENGAISEAVEWNNATYLPIRVQ